MKGYTSPVTTYTDEIMCDVIFLNPVHNAKYWSTRINKGDRDITIQMKQDLLPNIIMIKIDKNNKLLKRCNKKQVE